jgi:hypothetical protein
MAEDNDVVDEIDEDADAEPADLDADDLDADELDEDLVAGDGLEDEVVLVGEDALVEDAAVEEDEDEDAAAPERPTRTTPAAAGDDDEDEPDPDDVEADLDTILKDRIAANDDDEDEEEEEKPGRVTKPTDDDGTEGGSRVAPRKAGEFVCSSCFLVKPDMQLADAKKKLCLDCV